MAERRRTIRMENEAPVKKTTKVVKVYEKRVNSLGFEHVGYFVCEVSSAVIIATKRVVDGGKVYYGDLKDIPKDKVEHYEVIFEEDFDHLGGRMDKDMREKKAEDKQNLRLEVV